VRYCDDFVVLTRRRQPEGYLQDLKRFMTRLRLNLSEEKTRLVEAQQHFDFLGMRLVFKPTRRDRSRRFCYGFPSPKSMNKIRQKIREEVGRDYHRSMQEKIYGLTRGRRRPVYG
jgi:RNA-directed DNA polymerase